jgi:putative membrane protein
VRYLIVAVIASAITIFALQNTTPISVRFLVWSLPETPLASVILVSVVAGILLVGLPLTISRWRLRARARSLEARLASAEARANERASLPGSPAPPGAPDRPPTS